MARPYWSGQIQISLVSFGVKLFVATESKSQISFHQIDRATGERVRHQKVLASSMDTAPDEAAAPVEKSQIVKGYEYSKGQYVQIEPEEIAHLRVPSKHTMEVTQFVDAEEINPEYFEKPYFVAPENDSQTEAFLTVRKALLDTKKIAISKIAFGGREHVVAIGPEGDGPTGGLMAYTMRYAGELRNPAEYLGDIRKASIDADSLALAKELIKRKAAPFAPDKFQDGYEIALKELVDAKLKNAPIPRDVTPKPVSGKVVSLMDALRKSISEGAKDVEPEDLENEVEEAPAKPKKPSLKLVKGGKPAAKKAPAKQAHKTPKRKSA